MNRFLNILRRGAVYTTLILIVFYLFTFVIAMKMPGISAQNFFLILGFGMAFSFSLELFTIKRWKPMLKYGVHYVSLVLCFVALYLLSGNYASRGGSSLFVASVLFTVAYAAVAVPTALIKGRYARKRAQSNPSAYKSIYN